MPHAMFDTNVFNHILSQEVDVTVLGPDVTPIATHLQWDELNRTPDSDLRNELLAVFKDTVELTVATEGAVFGVSRWGASKYANPESRYQPMFDELTQMKARKNSANQIDALIANTCIEQGYTLVTNDRNLKEVATKNGCTVVDISTRGR